jgi:hypothetical protein
MLNLIDADRILLLQFHNGEHFFGSMTQVKATLSYQIIRPGFARIDKIINWPVSYFYTELELLQASPDDIVWLHVNECPPKCQVYLKSYGIELIGLKAIYNKVNIPIGILGIHFCSQDFIYTISDSDKERTLNNLIQTINNILL